MGVQTKYTSSGVAYTVADCRVPLDVGTRVSWAAAGVDYSGVITGPFGSGRLVAITGDDGTEHAVGDWVLRLAESARPDVRCKSTGFSSARYGACEICDAHVPDVWIGTKDGGYLHVFGHEACVKSHIALEARR